jgi:hypothetical protein
VEGVWLHNRLKPRTLRSLRHKGDQHTHTRIGLMWDRWQRGEPLQQMARLFDLHQSSVRRVLAETGCIRRAVRHRSDRTLTGDGWRDNIAISYAPVEA